MHFIGNTKSQRLSIEFDFRDEKSSQMEEQSPIYSMKTLILLHEMLSGKRKYIVKKASLTASIF